MRKLVFNLHLYAGLAVGLVLIVVSVTGCLLVFERTIDGWLNPSLSYVKPQAKLLKFGTILERLHASVPDKSVTELDLGGVSNSIVAILNDKSRAYFNGYTGQLLGMRAGLQPSFYIRQAHKALLAGKLGTQIVTIATFALLFQSLSGLYLWWPLKRLKVKLSASWRRINFDVHHSVGFFSCLFVCVLCLTGLVRSYPNVTKVFNGIQYHSSIAIRQSVMGIARPRNSQLTIDQAASIASAQLPGARLVRINIPTHKNDRFVISARYPGDTSPFGLSWVELDQETGQILDRKDFRAESKAEQLQRLDRSIHVGEIFGVLTRILTMLLAIAVVLQVMTGFVMWWKRTKRSAPRAITSTACDYSRPAIREAVGKGLG